MLTASTRAARESFRSDQARVDFARAQLTFLLQLAYSGELAAIRAYLGHRHSLRDRTERADLTKIIREEIRHRHCLLDQLGELRSGPDPWRERKMDGVGRAIAAFCQVGGWFFPMYGAGRLEAQNVREYEVAARLAHSAEMRHLVPAFLEMAETEWDHELYFRAKASGHPLWPLMPKWPAPPQRERIRASFRDFEQAEQQPIQIVRAPWLVR